LLADRVNESVAPLESLCKLAPNDAIARVRLAEAAMRQGNPRRAGELLAAAVQLAPDDPRLLEDVSRIYGRMRQMRQSADAARRGLAISPNDAALAQRLAWLLATSLDDAVRDGPAALALADKLVQAAPRDCRFLATQAAALGELGRFEEARARLAEAIAQCPDDQWIATKGKIMDLMFGSHERFQDVE
jgi:tetratricopeptide (TPR) repeat protein